MQNQQDAEIKRIEAEIETVDAQLREKLALQTETGRQLANLRRKKQRLKQRLLNQYPFDAYRIERSPK